MENGNSSASWKFRKNLLSFASQNEMTWYRAHYAIVESRRFCRGMEK